MCEAVKLSNVVTQDEVLPLIKSYDHLNKRLRRVTWKINTIYLHLQKTYGHEISKGGDMTLLSRD